MSSPTEEDLRRLFSRAPVGVFRSTVDGRFVFVNPALVAMLGYDHAEEVLALRMADDVYLAPDERGPLIDHYLSRGIVDGAEVQWRTRNGAPLIVRIYGYAVEDERGRGFEATAVDVTALRTTEAALRSQRAETQRSVAKLRLVLGQTPVLIGVVDPLGRITSLEGGAAALLTMTPDQLIGRSLRDFLAADAAVIQHQQAALAGETRSFELEWNGHAFAATMAPLRDHAGDIVGVIGAAFDVTAKRRIDARMQSAQRAESLGLLAGGVAHDFNNLLVAMLGNADLALRDLPAPGPARAAVTNIRTAALRAAELTSQLLAFSGGGVTGVSSVELPPVVDELLSILRPTFPPGVAVEVEMPSPLPPLRADATQLRQVLLNLITNAREALGPSGGQVSVRAVVEDRDGTSDDLDVVPPTAGRHVVIEVVDNGRGMDDATRRRVCEPFFTTKVTGHGLGLAAVLGIVRSHGGGLRVTSGVDEGTRFRVWWPAAPVVAAAAPTTAAARTVLVVDDEAMVRDVLCRMLEDLGYRTLEADGGDAALAIAGHAAQPIDLVIMDLTMPGLSGRAMLAALGGARPGVPVVLCSGYDRDRGRASDAAGFLPKPFRFEALEAVLADVLGAPA